MSAPEGGRIVVVAPNYAQARVELAELHPNTWQYVTRVEQLRGMPPGTRMLVLDMGHLPTSRIEMVTEAREVYGFDVVDLAEVAPSGAARLTERDRLAERGQR